MRLRDAIHRGRQSDRTRYYLAYTAAFACVALVVFASFLLTGKTFIWARDGWAQHFKALVFYAEYLRSIVRNLLSTGALALPTYSFSLGYGADIVGTLQYYVIGDPLNVLAALVPVRYLAHFYSAAVVLRLYLAGVAFSAFCRYRRRRKRSQTPAQTAHENAAAVSLRPALGSPAQAGAAPTDLAIGVAALVYAFCGFSLMASVRHPFFINPMIAFPLIIMGIDRIEDGRRGGVLVAGVFLSAICNFYFLYMLFVLAFIYLLARVAVAGRRAGARAAGRLLARASGCALLGLGLGAVVLVPVVTAFLGDARSGSSYVYDALYPMTEYLRIGGDFLSTTSESHWRALGYASIALVAIFALSLDRRGHRGVKGALLAGGAMMLVPAVGSLMNGFSYVTNRWIWGFSFLIAYTVAIEWDRLWRLRPRELAAVACGLAAYLVACLELPDRHGRDVYASLALAAVAVAIVAAQAIGLRGGSTEEEGSAGRAHGLRAPRRRTADGTTETGAGRSAGGGAAAEPERRRTETGPARLAVAALVAVNICLNATFLYAPPFDDYAREFMTYDEAASDLTNTEGAAVADVAKAARTPSGGVGSAGAASSEADGGTGAGFYRYTGTTTLNEALITHQHSTQYYWSLSNGNVTRFQRELGLFYRLPFKYEGVDGRSALATLANVRYDVGSGAHLYGYTQVRAGAVSTSIGDAEAADAATAPNGAEGAAATGIPSIWENEYALPFGYTYGRAISERTFEKLTPLQKQEAMLQAVAIGKSQGGDGAEADETATTTASGSDAVACTAGSSPAVAGSTDGLSFTGHELPVSISTSSGVAVSGDTRGVTLAVAHAKETMTLTFSGDANAETYLYLSGMDYTPAGGRGGAGSKRTSARLDIAAGGAGDTIPSLTTELRYRTPRFPWYNNQKNFLVNLGYGEAPKTAVTVTFNAAGTYTFNGMQVLSQPMDDYAREIRALGEDTLRDADFHDAAVPGATDRVTGRIELSQAKWLLLTIPCAPGWTAYVDGREQPIYQANIMYSALYLQPGKHTVELRYRTPGLALGAGVSAASAAILIAAVARRRSASRRVGDTGSKERERA